MRRLGLAGATLGLVLLVAAGTRAQSLTELGTAMAVHDAAAGAAAPSYGGVKSKATAAATQPTSASSVGLLANHGKRAAETEAKSGSGKGAWQAAGKLGGNTGGQGKSWTTASAAGRGSASGSGWATAAKGTTPVTRRR